MPRTRSSLLLLLPLAVACGRCGRPEGRSAAGAAPVAVVNGDPIGVELLRRELQLGRTGADGEAPTRAVKQRVLDDAIDRLLLLQQARARSIAVPQDQVERALLRLRADYPGTHFDDMLAQERISSAELKVRLRDQLTVEHLFADDVFPRLQVGDDEVERYYGERGAEFDEPERVRARQVVVRSREEAARLREELRRRPASFPDVARRASIAPEGRAGGDLGYFARGSGMPEVFDVCFRLPLLQVSDVTPSPYGFHLFQVTERKSAARRPFVDVKGLIREKLLRARRAQAQAELLADLRQKAHITIDPKALDAL